MKSRYTLYTFYCLYLFSYSLSIYKNYYKNPKPKTIRLLEWLKHLSLHNLQKFDGVGLAYQYLKNKT